MKKQKETTNFSLERDIPYFIKQDKNSFSMDRAERVEKYFRNSKNKNIFIMDDLNYQLKPNNLLDNENNHVYTQYYILNHVYVMPLKNFIEKLKKGKIYEFQAKLIELLIWSIVQEYKLILYDHQLYHNNIITENILIIQKQQMFYFLNNISSIDVRFINFDLSEQYCKNSDENRKNKDVQSLKNIIEELYKLIQKSQNVSNIKDLSSLIKFSESIKYNSLQSDDKKQPVFDMSLRKEYSERLNNLLMEKKNSILLTQSVLKSIFLQHYYLNNVIEQTSFDQLVDTYKQLSGKIEILQNNYLIEITNFQKSLNQYIIQYYKLDHNFDLDNQLIEDFDKNVFEKIVDIANFKYSAINEIEGIVISQYEKALEHSKMLIKNHFKLELEVFILNLYCDLI